MENVLSNSESKGASQSFRDEDDQIFMEIDCNKLMEQFSCTERTFSQGPPSKQDPSDFNSDFNQDNDGDLICSALYSQWNKTTSESSTKIAQGKTKMSPFGEFKINKTNGIKKPAQQKPSTSKKSLFMDSKNQQKIEKYGVTARVRKKMPLVCMKPVPVPKTVFKMYVYRDNCGRGYAESMRKKANQVGNLGFCVMPSFDAHLTTHFIPDVHHQMGVTLSKNFYLAICSQNIKVMYSMWLDLWTTQQMNEDEKELENRYTVDKIKLGKEICDVDYTLPRHILFEDLNFIFLSEFPIINYRFSQQNLMAIFDMAGGSIEVISSENLETKCKDPYRLPQTSSFVIAVFTGTQQKLCDNLFKELKWRTVHPDYFLECIWLGKINQDLIYNYLFTNSTMVKAKM